MDSVFHDKLDSSTPCQWNLDSKFQSDALSLITDSKAQARIPDSGLPYRPYIGENR